jgi:hypothetical protein
LPTEHLQLMAKDHDLQILGVLVASYEPSADSPEDQGHERPHHEVLPLLRCCPALRVYCSEPIGNKCTLHPSRDTCSAVTANRSAVSFGDYAAEERVIQAVLYERPFEPVGLNAPPAG